MITAYVRTNGTLTPVTVALNETLPDDAIWIDLLGPSREEEKLAGSPATPVRCSALLTWRPSGGAR